MPAPDALEVLIASVTARAVSPFGDFTTFAIEHLSSTGDPRSPEHQTTAPVVLPDLPVALPAQEVDKDPGHSGSDRGLLLIARRG